MTIAWYARLKFSGTISWGSRDGCRRLRDGMVTMPDSGRRGFYASDDLKRMMLHITVVLWKNNARTRHARVPSSPAKNFAAINAAMLSL